MEHDAVNRNGILCIYVEFLNSTGKLFFSYYSLSFLGYTVCVHKSEKHLDLLI